MERIENWWTRRTKKEQDTGEELMTLQGRAEVRVRHYLERFAELAEACYAGDGALDNEHAGGGGGKGPLAREARWAELVCIKADLHRALKRLTKQQARAVVLVLMGGYTEREAAGIMGIWHNAVHGHVRAGVKRIGQILSR